MSDRVIQASSFKARCLSLLDQVEQKRVSFVVTKRGRPVARLVPLEEDVGARSTESSVRLLADEDEEYFSTGERWEAQSGPA